mmetsp:Transcript_1878/g.5486  ORF Transcript_1878/g.5486 Transcript_1878/m.5486 type:complete len:579 (-) Transcript_1878:556-2292(-)
MLRPELTSRPQSLLYAFRCLGHEVRGAVRVLGVLLDVRQCRAGALPLSRRCWWLSTVVTIDLGAHLVQIAALAAAALPGQLGIQRVLGLGGILLGVVFHHLGWRLQGLGQVLLQLRHLQAPLRGGVVDGDFHYVHRLDRGTLFEHLVQVIHRRHLVRHCTVGLSEHLEIRVAELQPKILQAHARLLPPNHAVRIVVDDQDGDVEVVLDGSQQLLGSVHQEASVANDCKHMCLGLNKLGCHGTGHSRTHGGQRIVQQQAVGRIAGVLSREPHLVEAVVQAHDGVVVGHSGPHRLNQPRHGDREAVQPRVHLEVRQHLLLHVLEVPQIPGGGRLRDDFRQLPHGVGNVTDHFKVTPHDLVHLRCEVVQVHHLLRGAHGHDEGRLLHHIVADKNDEVAVANDLVAVVAGAQGSGAHPCGVPAVDHPLAHHGVHERDVGLVHEAAQHLARHLAVGPRAHHQQGRPCALQQLHQLRHRLLLRDGAPHLLRLEDHRVLLRHPLACHILRKFQMHAAGPLLVGPPHRLPQQRWHQPSVHDLFGPFGDWLKHHGAIHNLECALLALQHRLLACDDQHGKCPEKCVC